jgi:hypothetical protein
MTNEIEESTKIQSPFLYPTPNSEINFKWNDLRPYQKTAIEKLNAFHIPGTINKFRL